MQGCAMCSTQNTENHLSSVPFSSPERHSLVQPEQLCRAVRNAELCFVRTLQEGYPEWGCSSYEWWVKGRVWLFHVPLSGGWNCSVLPPVSLSQGFFLLSLEMVCTVRVLLLSLCHSGWIFQGTIILFPWSWKTWIPAGRVRLSCSSVCF